jgi:hypothetical protein
MLFLEGLKRKREAEAKVLSSRQIIFRKVTFVLIVIIVFIQSIILFYDRGLFSILNFLTPLIISIAIFKFIKDPKVAVFTYAFVTLLTSAYFLSIDKAEQIKKGYHYGVTFKIDGLTFESDSASYFVGKTEGYIFYYKSKEREAVVLPSNKIEGMTFPNR